MAVERRTQDGGNLAWLDLEMTGLDPSTDVILQAAVVITDRDLKTLETYTCDVWQPESALARMTPLVREMHEKTGLLERVKGSPDDVARCEQRLMQRVAGWCPYPATLCGNSIGYDRKFVDRYMPGLAGYLHYRMLDVSAIKVAAQLWYGDGAVFEKPAEGKHDALNDIKNSIAELAHYKKTLLKKP